MIKNRWMEQPPMAPDRDELAKAKTIMKNKNPILVIPLKGVIQELELRYFCI